MKLTKNEKKILKLLLENSRLTDTQISKKLNISKQAVGKIRKKLEEQGLIESYSCNLNYKKLGINIFVNAIIKQRKECKSSDVEKRLLEIPEIISAFKIPPRKYILILGFKEFHNFDEFFHSRVEETPLAKCIKVEKVSGIFSFNNIIKRDETGLLKQAIDEIDIKKNKNKMK